MTEEEKIDKLIIDELKMLERVSPNHVTPGELSRFI